MSDIIDRLVLFAQRNYYDDVFDIEYDDVVENLKYKINPDVEIDTNTFDAWMASIGRGNFINIFLGLKTIYGFDHINYLDPTTFDKSGKLLNELMDYIDKHYNNLSEKYYDIAATTGGIIGILNAILSGDVDDSFSRGFWEEIAIDYANYAYNELRRR